ncbi:hypothetical protein M011DRAFT_521834 [Sporormia fimetaria CBS 119925]|uniref:Uncharacterized protein n=1 Tax=Sporormia fimetaria CBS 119925 TaxID=1340428 RepID=A0A6A6UZH5_9PLEO|nr:hypothetical protein M011DRAFT_521834 [Sporormia fimetaria CBS 119925]
MPRKLPWATNGPAAKSGSRSDRAQTRPPKRPRPNIDSDDDEMFAGTVLKSSRKGKEPVNEFLLSDDEHPELPHIKAHKFTVSKKADRAPSSSPPPPAALLPPPRVEMMRAGVNKFDLRDDEWMMVEDELLETAKLFTRHLHVAEYDRLKEMIQTKKDIERPVVANATPSVDRQTQLKARKQTQVQRAALKDVLSFGGLDDVLAKPDPKHASRSAKVAIGSKSGPSDSDDLDAPIQSRHPSRTTTASFAKPEIPTKKHRPASGIPARKTSVSSDRGASLTSRSPSVSRRSPHPSASHPGETRIDSHVDVSSSATSVKTVTQRISVGRSVSTPRTRPLGRLGRPIDFFDGEDDLLAGSPLPKERKERLEQRRAGREKEKKEEAAKNNSITLNDIPTFLF